MRMLKQPSLPDPELLTKHFLTFFRAPCLKESPEVPEGRPRPDLSSPEVPEI